MKPFILICVLLPSLLSVTHLCSVVWRLIPAPHPVLSLMVTPTRRAVQGHRPCPMIMLSVSCRATGYTKEHFVLEMCDQITASTVFMNKQLEDIKTNTISKYLPVEKKSFSSLSMGILLTITVPELYFLKFSLKRNKAKQKL